MQKCKNCGHTVRKIKGLVLHRKQHSKYSGISSGGVTFNRICLNEIFSENPKFQICRCDKPEPKGKDDKA